MFVVAPHTTALRYEIRVLGRLDQHWADWFDGFEIVSCGDRDTAMVGRVSDQAALHGFLNKVRDLGLTLVAVTALDLNTAVPNPPQSDTHGRSPSQNGHEPDPHAS